MKPVPGHPGYYARADGRVVSMKTGRPRDLRSWRRSADKPYLVVELWCRNHRVRRSVHRLILLAFRGRPAPGRVARHLNGDPTDNRIENLEWGTVAENNRDQVQHGTAVCLRTGEAHPRSELTEGEVLEIEGRDRGGTESLRSIAANHGISHEHVRCIRDHETWPHLWGDNG